MTLKYSREQLKAMAEMWIENWKANGPESFIVTLNVSIRTGLSLEQVEHNIVELAK